MKMVSANLLLGALLIWVKVSSKHEKDEREARAGSYLSACDSSYKGY